LVEIVLPDGPTRRPIGRATAPEAEAAMAATTMAILIFLYMVVFPSYVLMSERSWLFAFVVGALLHRHDKVLTPKPDHMRFTSSREL
jgi:hypothetical protein